MTKGSPFIDNADYLLRKAIHANDNGIYFPVWGTCLGFQMLNIIISEYADVLSEIHGDEDIVHPIRIL